MRESSRETVVEGVGLLANLVYRHMSCNEIFMYNHPLEFQGK